MRFDFKRFSLVFVIFLFSSALLYMGCDEPPIDDVLSEIESLEQGPDFFSIDEWVLITELSPLPAVTAPYFHTGEFPTLMSVIEFKDAGGYTTAFPGMAGVLRAPLNLSEQEKNDLVEFLKTLTGELPPEHLLRKPAHSGM